MLKLTAREQEFFAALCSALRGFRYAAEVGAPVDDRDVSERMADIVEVFNMSPTKLDRLYDIMHRTGANGGP